MFVSVDHTRVILHGDGSPGSDYINANRINPEVGNMNHSLSYLCFGFKCFN